MKVQSGALLLLPMLIGRAASFSTVPLSYRRTCPVERCAALRLDAVSVADTLSTVLDPGAGVFVLNRIEVMTDDGYLRSQITGLTVTPSGWTGLVLFGLFQLLSPAGIVEYSKRLKEDEQAWLDLGKSPEQAVTLAYNNRRPPIVANNSGNNDSALGSARQQRGRVPPPVMHGKDRRGGSVCVKPTLF